MENFKDEIAEEQRKINAFAEKHPRINLSDFIGYKRTLKDGTVITFTADEVKRDLEYVEKREDNFKKNDSRATEAQAKMIENGVLTEALIIQNMESGDWFGEETELIQTSRYDDICNGIDVAVLFPQRPEDARSIGISFDLTTSVTKASEKLDKLLYDISAVFGDNILTENKIIPRIKYFDSKTTGKLRNFELPRVVLGLDVPNTERLANIFIENDGENAVVSKDDLARNSILFQIGIQLLYLGKICEIFGRKSMAEMYNKAYIEFQDILSKQGLDLEKLGKMCKKESFAVKLAGLLSEKEREAKAYRAFINQQKRPN